MGKQALNAPRGVPTFRADPSALVIIGHDTDDGPEHILWVKRCKQAASKELALDILTRGILEPVLVRQNGSSIEVIAGRRRTKAARLAEEMRSEDEARWGATPIQVPLIRKAGDDNELFGIIAAENAQREDLDILEQAQEMSRAVNFGATEAEIAVMYGVGQQTIRNRLQLLDAAKEVKDAARDGRISATAVLKLAALSHEEQRIELAEMAKAGDFSSARAARVARGRKAKKRGDNDTEYDPPGKRLLNKIVAHEGASDAIDANALRAIRWMLGLTAPSQIKGLSALIAAIEDGE